MKLLLLVIISSREAFCSLSFLLLLLLFLTGQTHRNARGGVTRKRAKINAAGQRQMDRKSARMFTGTCWKPFADRPEALMCEKWFFCSSC